MNEIKSYIITQNREYFSKNSEYIKLKNSEIKKLIKNGNIIIASDMLYTVPNDIIYKNIIEFPFDLDNKFIINKEDRIWKNLN